MYSLTIHAYTMDFWGVLWYDFNRWWNLTIELKSIMALDKLLANISRKFPDVKLKIKVDYLTAFFAICIERSNIKVFRAFYNIEQLILCLNFLYNANFSLKAIESLEKKKIKKRKRLLFFLWLENGKRWREIEGKTMVELWAEFLEEYAGDAERQERAQKRPNSSEELEQVGEDLEE